MTAVVVSNKKRGVFWRALGEIFKMMSHFPDKSSLTHPDSEQSSIEPTGASFIRCFAIISLLKINIGGTKLPVALMQQTTVVFVPLSPLVATATLALPRFARILESLATVEIPVSSMLYILEGSIAKKGSRLLKNFSTAILLKAVARFINVPFGSRTEISGCLFIKAANQSFPAICARRLNLCETPVFSASYEIKKGVTVKRLTSF